MNFLACNFVCFRLLTCGHRPTRHAKIRIPVWRIVCFVFFLFFDVCSCEDQFIWCKQIADSWFFACRRSVQLSQQKWQHVPERLLKSEPIRKLTVWWEKSELGRRNDKKTGNPLVSRFVCNKKVEKFGTLDDFFVAYQNFSQLFQCHNCLAVSLIRCCSKQGTLTFHSYKSFADWNNLEIPRKVFMNNMLGFSWSLWCKTFILLNAGSKLFFLAWTAGTLRVLVCLLFWTCIFGQRPFVANPQKTNAPGQQCMLIWNLRCFEKIEGVGISRKSELTLEWGTWCGKLCKFFVGAHAART